MLSTIGFIPSLLFFWGIGIIASVLYYVLIRKYFGLSWFAALLLGLIMILIETFSAKILFLLENPSSLNDGISWTGGYSLFGVFFFTPLFLFVLSAIVKMDYIKVLDFLVPGILLELAFYRIGCMCSGCCYGIYVGWGISNGIKEGLFPVQPIESVLDILSFIFILFVFLRKRTKGFACSLTYFLYGIIRFVLEFLRNRKNIFGVFSLSHFFALAVTIIGVVGLIFIGRKKRIE